METHGKSIPLRLKEASGRTFDVLVIGGGVNGAGAAYDLALRGLDVCLIDKADFGSGTTAKSTRLIHGGLRYLEYMEFYLVFESLTEREILLRNAPHLVRPLRLDLPTYQDDRYSLLYKECGMALYDLLSWSKSMPWHRVRSRRSPKIAGTGLKTDGLVGVSSYYDCQVDYPERLTLEAALCARSRGAELFNYVEARSLRRSKDGWETVAAFAEEPEKEVVLKSRAVVNATGPWVDRICERTEGGGSERKIRGTKGTHLLVRLRPGVKPVSLYVEAREDRRPFFILPWRGNLLVGTTDTHYEGSLEDCAAVSGEVRYLIDETNRAAPGLGVRPEDVYMTYAGVRPLPYAPPGTKPGAVTRRHLIYDHGRKDGRTGLFSLIGGKITTYRSLGAQTGDRLVAWLRKGSPRSATADFPLYGGVGRGAWREERESIVRALRDEANVPAPSAEHLADFYGSRALEAARAADGDPNALKPLTESHPAIAAQADYALRVEMALKLEDFFLRRSDLGFTPGHGKEAAEAVADRFARHHGWTAGRRDREIEGYFQKLDREFPGGLVV